jgi:hypothetical protein
MRSKIDAGNKLRSTFQSADLLALAACVQIMNKRFSARVGGYDKDKLDALTENEKTKFRTEPLPKTVYVIRQLKRPEEVKLLRQVYGPHFLLISANSATDKRLAHLVNEIGKTQVDLKPK